MEELFKTSAAHIALGVEICAALIIVTGAFEAVAATVRRFFSPSPISLADKQEIWVRFAMWLILALEFELAADILKTAITPTWTEIGQLAAIAVIRTFLNFFLERDIERAAAQRIAEAAGERPTV
jgi:uncharacterized membrane protein